METNYNQSQIMYGILPKYETEKYHLSKNFHDIPLTTYTIRNYYPDYDGVWYPAFTLGDLLNAIPPTLEYDEHPDYNYELKMCDGAVWYDVYNVQSGEYDTLQGTFINGKGDTMEEQYMDALVKLFDWLFKNAYIQAILDNNK